MNNRIRVTYECGHASEGPIDVIAIFRMLHDEDHPTCPECGATAIALRTFEDLTMEEHDVQATES